MVNKPSYKSDVLSEKAIDIHFNGHHMKYVENLEKLIGKVDNIDEVIKQHPKDKYLDIYNNACQVYNHNMFWQSLNPDNLENIREMFSKNNLLREDFKKICNSMFGSGWAWIIEDDTREMKCLKTSNADKPENCNIIFVVDLWEHAYYIDYENKRSVYIDHII